MIRTNKYFPIPLTFEYKFSIMTSVDILRKYRLMVGQQLGKLWAVKRLVGSSPSTSAICKNKKYI